MAEIKLNDDFKSEVGAFRGSAYKLDIKGVNTVYMGDASLPTVEAYHERLFRIREVMREFRNLVLKDARDMDALAEKLKAADKGTKSSGSK